MNPDWLTFQFSVKSTLIDWIVPFDMTVWLCTVWLAATGFTSVLIATDTQHYVSGPPADQPPTSDGWLAVLPMTIGQYQIVKTLAKGSHLYVFGSGVAYGFSLSCERIIVPEPV